MLLSRTTPAQVFNIRKPMWNGRKVGLASYKIGLHNEVNILTKDKNGNRLYPLPLYVSGEQAQKYNTMKLPSGVVLYLVTISDLEPLERSK